MLDRALASRARLALVALVLGTMVLSLGAGSVARPLFILGSAGVGYLAWREGTGRTIEVALTLYVFAPFLRRLVDVHAGFEPSGVMLLGPVLAILIPTLDLRHLLVRRERTDHDLLPMLLVGLCVTYGMLISAFAGQFGPLTTSALKIYSPLLYGMWLTRAAQRDPSVLDAAAQAFFVLGPIVGLYGIWQYVSPSDWDRFWMLNVSGTISVLGRPEPYQVRVFSLMNSPASFGTYAACSVLLFGFCRRGWQALVLALLVAPGLLVTYYRTAWISLVLGVGYCAMFGRTRERSALIALAIVVATMLAASNAEFGAAVMDRLSTLTGSVSDDGSGKARLGQLFEVYRLVDSMAVGLGFASLATPFNGVDAADGEIVTSIIAMGVFVGTVYLAALVWACLQALARVRRSRDPRVIVTGAVIVGMVAAIPLTSVTSGEIGLLLWMFVALATGQGREPATAPPPAQPQASR